MNKKFQTKGECLYQGLVWFFTGGVMIFPVGTLFLIIPPVGIVVIFLGGALLLLGLSLIISAPFVKNTNVTS